MRIGFYPGCSLNGTSREYNESVKAIGKALGIDWVRVERLELLRCHCGTFP